MVDGEIIENSVLAYHIEIIDKNNFKLYNLGELNKPKKNMKRSLKMAKRIRKLKRKLPIQIFDLKKHKQLPTQK